MTENQQDQPAEGGQQPYSGQPSSGEPYSGQPAPPPPPPPQAPAYGQPTYAQAPVSPSDARMWAMLAQLSGFLFGAIGPLVVYLIYKDRDPFIRRASAQALNFQIMVLIGYAISFVLSFILIGFLTGFAVFVCWIAFPIIAAIAANKGEDYDYPLIPQMVT
jgi:uncharacterized Tic20 family protein